MDKLYKDGKWKKNDLKKALYLLKEEFVFSI